MSSSIWSTISSIIRLIVLVAEVYYYKAKLKIESQIKYEKDIEKHLEICKNALLNLQEKAKKEYQQMDIEDEIDNDLNDDTT